jgi:ribosomal protein S18 acetylase RimI-like enzyme
VAIARFRRRARAPGFTLRPASAADYDFALALFLESPRELLEPQGKYDEARFTLRFREVFRPRAVKVITIKRAAIGWLKVSERADRFHIHYMLIAAPFRSRGIGTALIASLQARARAKRKSLTLHVLRSNARAIGLYRSLGFRADGGNHDRSKMIWLGCYCCAPLRSTSAFEPAAG